MSQLTVVTILEPIAVNRKVYLDQDPVQFQVLLSMIDCPTKLVILDMSLKFMVTQVILVFSSKSLLDNAPNYLGNWVHYLKDNSKIPCKNFF